MKKNRHITTPPPPHYDSVVHSSRRECGVCEGLGIIFAGANKEPENCDDCRGQGRKATGCA